MSKKTATNAHPSIALLMTGNELMSGDIVDSNSAWLGQLLDENGLHTVEKITVGDNSPLLTAQLKRLAGHYDFVLVNGGLGPTGDDLTAIAMAEAAGVSITVNEKARRHVVNWCEQRGFKANKANLKQAELPAGAEIFPDAPGSAPAFYLAINNTLVIATPGVPSELKSIMTGQILPFLKQRFTITGKSPWHRYQLFGIGESSLQQMLHDNFPQLDKHFDTGFRANFPYIELKLKPHTEATQTGRQLLDQLLETLGSFIIGSPGSTMAEALVEQLARRNIRIATAESCTGGMIASSITRISGASDVFPGSIVSYANEVKQGLLGVDRHVLERHGAVSEETVKAMLSGLFGCIACDVGIAVSGIAGPGGGSKEKPVGMAWLAWGNPTSIDTVCLYINLGRTAFQEMVSTIAMDLVRRQLAGLEKPAYLSRWLKKPT